MALIDTVRGLVQSGLKGVLHRLDDGPGLFGFEARSHVLLMVHVPVPNMRPVPDVRSVPDVWQEGFSLLSPPRL